MHVNMIVSSIKITNKGNVFAMYWFKLAMVILCSDLHIHMYVLGLLFSNTAAIKIIRL